MEFQNLSLQLFGFSLLVVVRTLLLGLCVSLRRFHQQSLKTSDPAGSQELTRGRRGPRGLDTPPCTDHGGDGAPPPRPRSESLETDWFSSECTGAFWWLQMCHWTERARSEPAGCYVVCGHVTCSRNSQGDLSAGSSITARSFSVSSGSHAHATTSPRHL